MGPAGLRLRFEGFFPLPSSTPQICTTRNHSRLSPAPDTFRLEEPGWSGSCPPPRSGWRRSPRSTVQEPPPGLRGGSTRPAGARATLLCAARGPSGVPPRRRTCSRAARENRRRSRGSAVGVPRSGFRGALPATSRSRFSRTRQGAAWPPPARLAGGRRSAGSGHGFLFSLRRFQGNYRHRDFPSLKVNAVYMHIFIHKMVTVIHNHSYH